MPRRSHPDHGAAIGYAVEGRPDRDAALDPEERFHISGELDIGAAAFVAPDLGRELHPSRVLIGRRHGSPGAVPSGPMVRAGARHVKPGAAEEKTGASA